MKIYRISEKEYPLAGSEVSGLKIAQDIPNTGSIPSSINNYEILSGIREVPLSDFDLTGKSYSVSENERIKHLSKEITMNGWISPLIVVIDRDGPYILEGGHRAEALYRLNVFSLPALIVKDKDNEDI